MALVDTAGLNQLESVMPAEAWEPLHWLAEGLDYQEVLEEFNDHRDEPVDTNDFIEAMERSKRRFHVVENEQELLQMLNAPLEKMACIPAPEPAKTGGVSGKWSGTCIRWCRHGKTVVAMHRARWLSQRLADKPGKKVLFWQPSPVTWRRIFAPTSSVCVVVEEMARLKLLTLMPG